MGQRSHSIWIAFPLLVVAAAVVRAEGGVLGTVAAAGIRLDGAAVPSGSTVVAPSLVETSDTASIIHLTTGQDLRLAPHSSARLDAHSQGGVEISARAGRVEVSRLGGEPLRLASHTVALLAAQEPSSGAPIERLKMCRGESDPVWVELTEAGVAYGVEQGWGVAGVDPYDQDCHRKKVAGVVWTPAKIAGLVAGGLAVGYVVGDQLQDEKVRQVECQSPDASPIVPGVPICHAD